MTETSPRDMQLLLQNTVRLDVQCSRDNGSILVKVSGIETAEVQTYFYSLSGPKPIFHFVSLTPLSLHREPSRFYITGSLVLKCLNNLCDILIGTRFLNACARSSKVTIKKRKYPQSQVGWKDYLCILIFDIFSVHETS